MSATAPRSWTDPQGYTWLEAGEAGSGMVFCYDEGVARLMGGKWPLRPLEDAEAEFGQMAPGLPGGMVT